MREIKFRVWDEFRMLSDEELRISARELYSEVGKSGQYEGCILIPNCEDLEVMQYTGLKDKNGTEIYEGDIIQTKDFYECGELIFKGKLEVIKSLNDYISRCAFIDTTGKVIGNIYENKDLLEEVK